MSNLNAVRTELRLVEEQHESPDRRRLVLVAVTVLLMIAVAVCLAATHYLPTFNADDAGSILFGAG